MHRPADEKERAAVEAAQETTEGQSIATVPAEDNRFAELQRRADHAGHTLSRTAAGGFVLRRWTYSSHAGDLDAVAALLDRMQPLPVDFGEDR